MINLRGKIVPVVDLRMRMGLPIEAQTGETRIVIAETGGLAVGMVVDAVREVMTLSEEECETPSELITDVDSDLVVKVGKRDDTLILLMNLDKALHISTEDRQ
jgi:purine-binding chemotaxis protein CheW